MEEHWKEITGYEGLYQISDQGRVKNVRTGRILRHWKNKGYPQVRLSKYGKGKHFFVHRLVAIMFIPNPNNLPEVNHRDENPQNPCVDNLEWCTKKYNQNYATINQRRSQKQKGVKRQPHTEEWKKYVSELLKKNPPTTKPIACYNLDGSLLRKFKTIKEAEIKGFGQSQNICRCAKGKRPTAYGYIWRYVDEREVI